MWASKISMELVQHGRIALQDQLSRLEAVADEFRVFVSETCKSHDCRGLICLGRVVLRCLKDKRLFSRSLFFTISTRHGIMESWNQYVWLANMICFRLLHWSQKQMTQGVSKIFQAILWVSLSHGVSLGLSQHVFCIFFFVCQAWERRSSDRHRRAVGKSHYGKLSGCDASTQD